MRRAAVTLAIVLAAHAAAAQTTGYKMARKPRMGLVVTGAAMLGLGWLAGVLSAALSGFHGISPALIVANRSLSTRVSSRLGSFRSQVRSFWARASSPTKSGRRSP